MVKAVNRRAILSPTAIMRRKVVSRGVFGGSRGWLVVGGLLFVGRNLRKLVSGTEEVAAVEVLRPGERLLLTTIPAPTRQERKDAKRTAKAARKAR
jgi:hypothetical protein